MSTDQQVSANTSSPVGVRLLELGTLVLSITALFGGLNLLLDPTGQRVDLVIAIDLHDLAGTPFSDYTIPGVILVVFLGLYPLVVLYGQLRRRSWAWPASILVALVLLIWISVEVSLIGYISLLQPAYAVLGIVLLGLCFVPSVRAVYRRQG